MNDFKKLIKEEIKWCEENPNSNLSEEYKKGFIQGLKQALNFIGQYEVQT
jgi:hypothetical protein